jgi:ABC-2 type transport system ATP-binding protein/ribosome-dependent ATPase
MTALAEARGVTRRFGAFTAVSEVSLTVGPGEVVGLLGANGAGKTTLIRLLLGLLLPDEDAVRHRLAEPNIRHRLAEPNILLFGTPPSRATRRRVGYVPQTLGLYGGLTVAENWRFTTAAFRNGDAPLPADIALWRNELVASLPLGSQRNVAFAVALSHHPELLILDEPTSGLGPLGSARLWDRVRSVAGDGAGVLVTTHNMEEAEQCDRLVVMADGRVVATGTAAGIIGDRTATEIHCDAPERAFAVLDAHDVAAQTHGDALRVAESASVVAALISDAGITATVEAVPANLEEAFIMLVGSTGVE